LAVCVACNAVEAVKGLNEPNRASGTLNASTAQIQSEIKVLFASTVEDLVRRRNNRVNTRIGSNEMIKKELTVFALAVCRTLHAF
jgi:hypothetical protein